MVSNVIYCLCAITSALCAGALFRAYYRRDAFILITRSFAAAELLLDHYLMRGNKLLFWCGTCFVGLLFTNILLVLDFVLVHERDFTVLQHAISLLGVISLLYGIIAERVSDSKLPDDSSRL